MSNDEIPNVSAESGERLLAKALRQLQHLVDEAGRRNLSDANSASLATADKDARPSVRTIYLNAIVADGLVFFVNMESGKGKQLEENPRAAMCFFWPELQEQVIVEGDVEILSGSLSDRMWLNRSRESHMAAWASDQARVDDHESTTTSRRDAVRGEHSFEGIPRPDNWKALEIHPDRFEFWQTGWRRLRARHRYQKNADGTWEEYAENP